MKEMAKGYSHQTLDLSLHESGKSKPSTVEAQSKIKVKLRSISHQGNYPQQPSKVGNVVLKNIGQTNYAELLKQQKQISESKQKQAECRKGASATIDVN